VNVYEAYRSVMYILVSLTATITCNTMNDVYSCYRWMLNLNKIIMHSMLYSI
jgi:hypothetical protein